MAILSGLCLRRNVVALLAFFGSVCLYILRANLNIAIVAMTEEYNKITPNGTIQYIKDFNWNSKEKGNILGAFFYGYASTQLIGGWLGGKFGGARMYGIGILATAIFNLAIPVAAHLGVKYLIIARIIEGAFEGITFPCIQVVWSRWAPVQERTQLATFGYAGMFAGTVFAFPVCGFLAQTFGWPSIFYVTSSVTIIWYFIWVFCVRNDPQDDPWISEMELEYIKESLEKNEKVIVYPWKAIFTSVPFWALVFTQSCEGWGFYTLLVELPTFVYDTSHKSIQSVGLLSAIPYLVMSFVVPFCGFIADRMRKNNLFTTTQVRKICNTIAYVGQAVFITCAIFMETVPMIILFLTLALGSGACAWSSVMINQLDIAPQYAGVLAGISTTFSALTGFLSPLATGYIVQNKTKEEWRIVFYLTVAIYLLGAIIYLIFGSGERQPWADEKQVNEVGESGKSVKFVQDSSYEIKHKEICEGPGMS